MRAIVIIDAGPHGGLELREVNTPEPGPGQVRVRIRACAINRADLLQRRGLYPAPHDAPPDIPGLEIAGEVDAIGANVTRDVAVGDRVYGIVSGGAYAEYVVVHSRTLAKIPAVDGSPMSFTEAAAIPEAFLTAYDAIILQAGLLSGERLLVHAVGSGVGTAAAQIGRAVGARVIGTARSKDKLARAAAFGMSEGLLVEGDGKFADRVQTLGGADVVLELVGGHYVPESLAAMSERGRLVLVGLMAGGRAEIDLSLVLRRRLRVFGTVLRARPLEEKILAAQVLARHITPLVAEKKLVPIIDAVLPLDGALEAHERMASNASFGKIVLEV